MSKIPRIPAPMIKTWKIELPVPVRAPAVSGNSSSLCNSVGDKQMEAKQLEGGEATVCQAKKEPPISRQLLPYAELA